MLHHILFLHCDQLLSGDPMWLTSIKIVTIKCFMARPWHLNAFKLGTIYITVLGKVTVYVLKAFQKYQFEM